MTRFLRENYALVAGIALPLILIAVFFFAGRASVMGIDDPQYDAVFATNYAPRATNNAYALSTDRGKLVIRPLPEPNDGRYRNRVPPEIYRFDHRTGRARQIDIDFRNVVDGRVADPDLEALNEKGLITDAVAPDGYEFEYSGSGGRGLFSEIFGGSRYRSRYVLRKGARRVPIIGPRNYYAAHFIGWVKK